MNRFRICTALVCLFWTLVSCATLAQAQIVHNEVSGSSPRVATVYPTGIFPDDVHNVQNAIDVGGTVLLKAVNMAGQPTAFNFGTPEVLPGRTVFMNVDVRILGERVGEHRTTVQGGLSPFTGLAQVKSAILGIDFEGPKWEAIVLGASAGSDISDNRIHGLVAVKVCVFPPACPAHFTYASGIDIGGGAPELVTGKIRIADNDIEGLLADTSNDAFPPVIFGMQVDTASADFEITGNTIRDTPTNGIGVERVQGSSVRVTNNRIEIGGPDASAAIFINGDHSVRFEISKNQVVTTAPAPFLDGIALASNELLGTDSIVGALVHDNHVTMQGSFFGGISFYDAITDSTVNHNVIDGDGAFALQVSSYGVPPILNASSDRFIENDVRSFNASVADVLLDANSLNDLVVGDCASSLDFGIGNSVHCKTRKDSSAKSHMRLRKQTDAHAAANNSALHKLLRDGALAPGQIQ
jgi:Right handed beta helix region